MILKQLVPGALWHAPQPLRLGPLRFNSRMTIARLADGGLWVHSPAQPRTALVREIDALGIVRDVVAPNRHHHRFLLPFLAAFPRARGWMAPGLQHTRPEFEHLQVLDADRRQQWQPELRGLFVEGLPVLNEIAWYHADSRTLLVTDLLLDFSPDNAWPLRAGARLLTRPGRPSMGWHTRLMIRDRDAFAASVESILALDFERLVLAHDRVIEEGARERFAEAFDWLLCSRGRLARH